VKKAISKTPSGKFASTETASREKKHDCEESNIEDFQRKICFNGDGTKRIKHSRKGTCYGGSAKRRNHIMSDNKLRRRRPEKKSTNAKKERWEHICRWRRVECCDRREPGDIDFR